jgi:hypothetical protein
MLRCAQRHYEYAGVVPRYVGFAGMPIVQRLHLLETIAYDREFSFLFAMGFYAANNSMSLRNIGHLGGTAFDAQ